MSDLKGLQEKIMTIALLYNGNIASLDGRTVNFSFPSGDNKRNFQHHLEEIRFPSIKMIKNEHGLALGIEFSTLS